MHENTATFETTFFIEHDQVCSLISTLSSSDNTQNAASLSKLRSILDKYLECPMLLDPYLERLVSKLSLAARGIIHGVFLSQNDKIQNDDLNTLMHLLSAIYALSKVRGRKFIQRLLPHEVSDVEPVLAMLRYFGALEHKTKQSAGDETPLGPMHDECMEAAKIWESIYSLLNWLGIISLVPFDLHTIDSTLETESVSDQNTSGSLTLVQSILSTSISHLNDSGPTREAAAACLASLLSRPDLEQSELERFILWSAQMMYWFRSGTNHLGFTGNETNHDQSTVSKIWHMPEQKPSVLVIMGILQALSAVFKSGHRSNLLSTKQKLHGIELLWEQSILVAESSIGSMLLRKLLVKLFARIGCAYLPPRVAAWRYQRGRRSLLENLMSSGVSVAISTCETEPTIKQEETQQEDHNEIFLIPDQVEDAMDQLLRSLTDSSTIVRWSSAKGIGRLTERLPAVCAEDVLDALLQTCSDPERDRNWHGTCLCLAELARRGLLLPARLGEVVPIVVQAIGYDIRRGQHSVGAHVRDAACYTCWAFARAYSSEVLRPHVKELSVALVLASLFDREVNCRRAASAAFQESVGRQGADNFKHGIAILTAADYFSLGNRTDAYMKIALVIAKFDEYQNPIINHLSGLKLHHWDSEIRIVASQSLARVSQLNPFYCVNQILPTLLEQSFNDDLVVRHGSLLGAAEIFLSLGELNLVEDSNIVDDDMKVSIIELVPSIEKARLYRGRGGEIMRSASCRMIECISLTKVPMTVKQQVRLLDSIDSCLAHPNEEIQQAAASALKALLTNYFPVSNKGPSERLQGRVVDKYILIVKTEDNPAATRGFTLALGSLPRKLLAPNKKVLDSVLDCLCNASRKDALVGSEGDAETRRNAIKALVSVCQTVGVCCFVNHDSIESSQFSPLTKQQTMRVFSALLDAMEDYNMERRGDVGSWSRIAAMKGLETLVFLSINATQAYPHSLSLKRSNWQSDLQSGSTVPTFTERLSFSSKVPSTIVHYEPTATGVTIFDEPLCISILSALLKQLGEKLDAVRNQAGECLERLLTNNTPRLPFVPYRHMLVRALQLSGQPKNWSNPAVTFPLLMCVINIDVFFEPILSGVVISVGGLTESVSKSSCAALFEWIKKLRKTKATSIIIQMGEGMLKTAHGIERIMTSDILASVDPVFLSIFRRNRRNNRVLMPLLATMDKLIAHGYFDELLSMENDRVVGNMLDCLSCEATGCTDVKRLLAIVRVSLNLLQPDMQTIPLLQQKVLSFIMVMLLNPYPRVRRYTAEQLFAKLSVDGYSMFAKQQCLEKANNILLSVAWHEEQDTSGHIAKSRNRIADLLDIQLSQEERSVVLVKNQTSKALSRDEFENYSSLINSTTT